MTAACAKCGEALIPLHRPTRAPGTIMILGLLMMGWTTDIPTNPLASHPQRPV